MIAWRKLTCVTLYTGRPKLMITCDAMRNGIGPVTGASGTSSAAMPIAAPTTIVGPMPRRAAMRFDVSAPTR